MSVRHRTDSGVSDKSTRGTSKAEAVPFIVMVKETGAAGTTFSLTSLRARLPLARSPVITVTPPATHPANGFPAGLASVTRGGGSARLA